MYKRQGVLTASSGPVTVAAASRGGSTAVADGSPVASGADGVGLAVAVNLADVTTRATVDTATIAASDLAVAATTAPELITEVNRHRSQATSGGSEGSGDAATSLAIAGAGAATIASYSTLAEVLSLIHI